jgi:signal transduction histidine kinase
VALARLHGGSLGIDSQKGKGTRVSLSLPIHQEDGRPKNAVATSQFN